MPRVVALLEYEQCEELAVLVVQGIARRLLTAAAPFGLPLLASRHRGAWLWRVRCVVDTAACVAHQ